MPLDELVVEILAEVVAVIVELVVVGGHFSVQFGTVTFEIVNRSVLETGAQILLVHSQRISG